jgi:hypothetical protein
MQPEAVLVIMFVLGAMVVVLGVLFMRNRQQQMLHQERMAALEKGTTIPLGPMPRPWSPRVYLLRGLIWTFSGAALGVCLAGLATTQRAEPAEVIAMNAKSVSESLNIPVDQARQMVERNEDRGMPVGIALLGLIPLGVGFAYLIFYWSDPSRHATDTGAQP